MKYVYIESTRLVELAYVKGKLCQQEVRSKLAPWDKKIAGAQSRLDVATAERDLLSQQHTDAEQRLKVIAWCLVQ